LLTVGIIKLFPRRGATVQRTFKTYTMQNRLKTKEDKLIEHYALMQKEYAKESLGTVWFFIIMGVALLLTALIENL
jgi:hypothetical protein